MSDLSRQNRDKQIVVKRNVEEGESSNTKEVELEIGKIEESLQNWSIPITNKNDIASIAIVLLTGEFVVFPTNTKLLLRFWFLLIEIICSESGTVTLNVLTCDNSLLSL